MAAQEGTPIKPHEPQDTTGCERLSALLARIADKWALLVVRALGGGPLRFSALKRELGSISQKMLTVTLRTLERDGFISRTVVPATPPQVEYALTPLGRDLFCPVAALVEWTEAKADAIEAARAAYEARHGHLSA